MSGGMFDYNQYRCDDIKDDLQKLLNNDLMDYDFIEDKERFKEVIDIAIYSLTIARIYTQRIDWFLSGDDGEDSLYKRLEEDLKECSNER